MKPIPFNTEMVQAILEGRKTVTRRKLKLPKYVEKQENGLYTLFAECSCYQNQHLEEIVNYLNYPYKVGDILYVRETWKIQSMSNADKRIKFLYKATGDKDLEERYVAADRYEELLKYESKSGWQPSLFMPKEAARIFLKVTDIRVERLREITLGQIEKEGIENKSEPPMYMMNEFERLWNSTIKKQDIDKYGWKVNPWVWVIEFERVEAENEN